MPADIQWQRQKAINSISIQASRQIGRCCVRKQASATGTCCKVDSATSRAHCAGFLQYESTLFCMGRPSTTPSRGAGYGLPNVDATITHFGPPDQPAELAHSAKVFPLIFNLYEVYLGTKFPFGCLQQVGSPLLTSFKCHQHSTPGDARRSMLHRMRTISLLAVILQPLFVGPAMHPFLFLSAILTDRMQPNLRSRTLHRSPGIVLLDPPTMPAKFVWLTSLAAAAEAFNVLGALPQPKRCRHLFVIKRCHASGGALGCASFTIEQLKPLKWPRHALATSVLLCRSLFLWVMLCRRLSQEQAASCCQTALSSTAVPLSRHAIFQAIPILPHSASPSLCATCLSFQKTVFESHCNAAINSPLAQSGPDCFNHKSLPCTVCSRT